ncbi:Prolycopene isomerase, chloroplastic [Porphyridium purpureum]|uniref:Prolycopene isomerase, chloroplastic n=1 Tax=Porphyridium purpureum TaxID=35688 RepID=A0A5J4YLX4_PORPP|nr:Prolycopene isomerase, chloroplastic [Porphyridium purpureum]|eukprot:POR5895..scf295_9
MAFQVASFLPKLGNGDAHACYWRCPERRQVHVSCPHPGASRLTMRMKADRSALDEEADVIVIGSGLSGLVCAAMVSKFSADKSVVVLEAHTELGGCLHEYKRGKFTFESGPSLYAGLASEKIQSANPLQIILQKLGIASKIKWVKYDRWGAFMPNGVSFAEKLGAEAFENVVLPRVLGEHYAGDDGVASISKEQAVRQGVEEWRRLMKFLEPVGRASREMPMTALRSDLLAVPLLISKYPKEMIQTLTYATMLQKPLGQVLDELGIRTPFLRNWLDLLCFLLQGRPARETPLSCVSFMIAEWFQTPTAQLDYPVGGSASIANALVQCIQENGGRVHARSRVSRVLWQGSRCVGVEYVSGSDPTKPRLLRAGCAVVSNADTWTTRSLLSDDAPRPLRAYFDELVENFEPLPSFIHLHAAIDSDGLPAEPSADFPAQWAVVDEWGPIECDSGVEAKRNVVIVSVSSLLDPNLAPPGHHVLHAYTPATEPYADWASLDTGSDAYKKKKAEAGEFLWKAVSRCIPDARSRCKLELIGTPLTHARFLNRYHGTYGAKTSPLAGMLPWSKLPGCTGFFLCSDSAFPGIGIPACAAAGAMTANSILSWHEYRRAHS